MQQAVAQCRQNVTFLFYFQFHTPPPHYRFSTKSYKFFPWTKYQTQRRHELHIMPLLYSLSITEISQLISRISYRSYDWVFWARRDTSACRVHRPNLAPVRSPFRSVPGALPPAVNRQKMEFEPVPRLEYVEIYGHSFTLMALWINAKKTVHFNYLQTKRKLHYLKTQSVPRCKHFSSGL